MQTTLTGPDNCAQCGEAFDMDAIVAGVQEGRPALTSPAYVVIRGHKVPVPGLYWDAGCATQIDAGTLESGLTYAAALAFLDDIWGPMVVAAGLTATALGDEDKARMAAAKLADVLEVSLVLETVIEALEDGTGLDWLPECDGHCGGHGDQEVNPRDVAHLN